MTEGDDALCSVAVQEVQLRAPIFHMEDIARVKDALAVEGNEQAPSSPHACKSYAIHTTTLLMTLKCNDF
jgi:hypothetical protein